jgi:exonuclease SbcD
LIRIAHTSDLHIDERGRLEDVVLVLDAFIEQTREAEVDLVVVAGDHFERRSTPAERNVLATFLQEASAACPVVCVKGNHDAADDLDIFGELESVHPIHILDRPTATPGSAVIIEPPRSPARIGVLALPWFDKVHLAAGLDATVDAEQTRQMAMATARDLLTCLRAEATRLRSEGVVPVLVAHATVQGSEVATGQTLIGIGVEFTPGDLRDVDAAYTALGHIHMSQDWFGGRVAYSGSPNRCNFGESEPKGWRLVTLTDDGGFVANEFRELPARPMVLLEHDCTTSEADLADFCPLAIDSGEWSHIAGALVRIRYRIKAEDLHRLDERAIAESFRRAGAHEVKLEAVVEAETRVRAEEIAQATSIAEKVDAYFRAKGIDIADAARERLHSKLGELEAL